jgi:hypothetical protein
MVSLEMFDTGKQSKLAEPAIRYCQQQLTVNNQETAIQLGHCECCMLPAAELEVYTASAQLCM